MWFVLPDFSDLGEQTLNKIAEMALMTQLDEAERLNVYIKTDPGLLSQGKLDSLTIDGDGLVMKKDLRMQRMQIELNNIAVSPLKALTGNIELTEPSDGNADIVLTAADINRAFNSQKMEELVENPEIEVDGKAMVVDMQGVECQLRADERIAIDARFKLSQTQDIHRMMFTCLPRIAKEGRGVVLEDVEFPEGKELSPKLTEALLAKVSYILNLSNFEMQGISLQIQGLQVQQERMSLEAIAHITQFPSV